jgi:hypothetical protein
MQETAQARSADIGRKKDSDWEDSRETKNKKTKIKMKQNRKLYRIWDAHKMGMNNSVFWDIALCSPLKVNRRFG